MTNFIPIFPLQLIVYPGEALNLHIFEPRYKQLINDCFTLKKPFGIPSVLNNNVSEFGCLVEIVDIVKTYDNGEMDISTQGTLIFKILENIETIPNKLYRGAIATYPVVKYHANKKLQQNVVTMLKELHLLLNVTKNFKKADADLLSFDIAHHIGLTLQEEYQLLQFEEEVHRLEFLSRHLIKSIAVLKQMDHLREKIQQNGHFKNLSGFNFS
jgi:uncharacterized protein